MKKFNLTDDFIQGYFLTTIEISYNQIVEKLGYPNVKSSEDKIINEWALKDNDDNLLSIYDWKEYRTYPNDEKIIFHIGGENKLSALELIEFLKK